MSFLFKVARFLTDLVHMIRFLSRLCSVPWQALSYAIARACAFIAAGLGLCYRQAPSYAIARACCLSLHMGVGRSLKSACRHWAKIEVSMQKWALAYQAGWSHEGPAIHMVSLVRPSRLKSSRTCNSHVSWRVIVFTNPHYLATYCIIFLDVGATLTSWQCISQQVPSYTTSPTSLLNIQTCVYDLMICWFNRWGC